MRKPHYINDDIRKSMTWKEQDLVVLLREKHYTKSQIKRRLYILSDAGYWKLRKRVHAKIDKQYIFPKEI